MGQVFRAVAYDTETRMCSVAYADKFHANCYSHRRAVLATQYLLREKAYNAMWSGDDVLIGEAVGSISDDNVLLGISTYRNYKDFKLNIPNLRAKPYYEKVKFIDENSKLWKIIEVRRDAVESYRDESGAYSAKYSGFLLNHTQKLAIDLC